MTNIKMFIKYCLGKVMGAHDDKIIQATRQAEIVSFDIFDTLVKRNVPVPESVHKFVHKEFLRQTGIDVHEYVKLRIDAEHKARSNSKKEEISLDDIFCNMESVTEDCKSVLRKIEEQIEISVCCPNLRMKAIYDQVLENDKKIIITSDMYLDEEVIKKILHKCGYDNYEKIYLSSTYGKCKTTGSIYEVIKTDYFDFSGKILHIGDNVKGDYVIPRMKGLKALLIDGQQNLLKFWKSKRKKVDNQFLYKQLYTYLNNHAYDIKIDAVSIGYEVLGPMLLGYCKWLNKKIQIDKIDKIFFLSREGKILQDAFNILYPQTEIPQNYLYVSRQSLVVPLLADANDFDEMVNMLKYLSHSPLLKMIPIIGRLDKEKFNIELKHIGLDGEMSIYEVPKEKKGEIYSIIKKLGESRFKQQKGYIEKYLKENDFSGNIAIVDIGWSGTMQYALQKFVSESDTILHGYYLGVRNMETDDYYLGLQRNGYLFEPGKNEDFDLMVRFTTEIIEMMFLNRTGSVQEYDIKKDVIVPIFTVSEYDEFENGFIETLQSVSLNFLDVIKQDRIFKDIIEIPADIIMSIYSIFAIYPNLSTVKIFDGFQVLNGCVRQIIPQHGILYYMLHPRELMLDFYESSCKIFFMKKLFKIKFPYFYFLKLLLIKWNIKAVRGKIQ
ncbi:MAG: hypothetical protein NC489_33035 [Ruminococcus flavefaciens]|nr:hypothetical protein [Roseburia sp.]MCM1234949.1 hypothetical protein [Ruminococcus flavefaciens]